ncbi:MAG: putative selenate reductase subunit YgfK, partial [Clostridiales bacterium]
LEVVQDDDAKRCLHCDGVCENCVDVCPNRANIALHIEGLTQPEILHFDDFCNECGNCTMFCPYDGAPYLEKTTYFSGREHFENSSNPGFCLVGDGVLYRQGDVVEQCRVEDLEGALRSIVEYVIDDYSFIIPKEGE